MPEFINIDYKRRGVAWKTYRTHNSVDECQWDDWSQKLSPSTPIAESPKIVRNTDSKKRKQTPKASSSRRRRRRSSIDFAEKQKKKSSAEVLLSPPFENFNSNKVDLRITNNDKSPNLIFFSEIEQTISSCAVFNFANETVCLSKKGANRDVLIASPEERKNNQEDTIISVDEEVIEEIQQVEQENEAEKKKGFEIY